MGMDEGLLSIDQLISDIFKSEGEITHKSDNLSILLDDLKPETRSVYRTYINKFLMFVRRDTFDKWDVKRFLNHLRARGYSQSSINTAWFALKLLFEANDLPWDMRRRDKPRFDTTESFDIPVMDVEDVGKIIRSVKNGLEQDKVIIALSTTYGLRRGEIAGIQNKDIIDNTIFIRTKKHGRPRKHLIPDEIGFIREFDYNKMLSKSTLNYRFRQICRQAGIKLQNRQGFHSIRHALSYYLTGIEELPPLRVVDFMRWERKDLAELPRYSRSKMTNFEEVDSLIFRYHPFLKFWR